MPKVAVIMGSKSDAEIVKPALDILDQMGLEHEVKVISAHRNPEKIREYGVTARDRKIEVIIAGAGMAAHLPGVIASWTTLPVIGVPLPSGDLRGIDALLSMTQMPGGIPVACVAIGKPGAKNSALLAAQILGLKYNKISAAYEKYRQELAGN